MRWILFKIKLTQYAVSLIATCRVDLESLLTWRERERGEEGEKVKSNSIYGNNSVFRHLHVRTLSLGEECSDEQSLTRSSSIPARLSEYKISWPCGNIAWNCFKNCPANFPSPAWMALKNTGNGRLVDLFELLSIVELSKYFGLQVLPMYIVTGSERYVDSVDEMEDNWSVDGSWSCIWNLIESIDGCCSWCTDEVDSYTSTSFEFDIPLGCIL